MRKQLAASLAGVALLALAACSTDKQDTSTSAAETSAPAASDTTTGDTTAPSDNEFGTVVDDRAPGVTDDTIKVGIMYLDLTNVKAILGIDQGDYEAAYQAAIDEVNDNGGVHGRKIEAVMMPIDPPQVETGTVACTKLTEDEQVFVVVGSYLQAEAESCVVDTHETPLLGGDLAADIMKGAKAAWLSPGTLSAAKGPSLQALIDAGVITGKVGVVGQVGAEAATTDEALPMLEKAGIDVVDVAYYDIMGLSSDPNALYGQAETISLKFQSEGVETLLLTEGIGSTFPNGIARTDYRPHIVFTDNVSPVTYTGGDGSDLSMMPGSVAVGSYDSLNVFHNFGSPTKECVASQEKRLGITIKHSAEVPKGEPDYAVSSKVGCMMVALLVAVLEKAGPDLNWGTFNTAAYNLGDILLPFYDTPFTVNKDHPDGSPSLYVFDWDADAEAFVPRES